MTEQPTKIGNKTLYNVRVLNMSVAKHYDLPNIVVTEDELEEQIRKTEN